MSKTIAKVITPYTTSVLKNLHELAAVSEAAAQYVRTLNHHQPVIIPNGIDLKKYRPSDSPKRTGKKSILYIGRLERRKGIKYLLKAFALLAEEDPKVQLIIAGEGPDRQKLELFVDDNKIPRVVFKGFVSEKEKLDLFAQADVFCSPATFGESFGIVLLEAMARGCVVVAGDNPGYRAVMQQTGKLSLVIPKDVQEFTRRLDLMLNDKAVRELWLGWAAEYVKQFSYGNIVDQYEKLYQRALEHKR